jgi:hypothetical protein
LSKIKKVVGAGLSPAFLIPEGFSVLPHAKPAIAGKFDMKLLDDPTIKKCAGQGFHLYFQIVQNHFKTI